MSMIRLPKTLRWLFTCAFLLLCLLTIYRIIIFFFYFDNLLANGRQALYAFSHGLRFDLCVVSIITLFLLIVSLIPASHIFKTRLGKKIALISYTVYATFLQLLHATDFTHLIVFKTRLSSKVFEDMDEYSNATRVYWSKMPVLLLFLLAVVSYWVFYLLINYLYKKIARNKQEKRVEKTVKQGWQLFTAVICLLFIITVPAARIDEKTAIVNKEDHYMLDLSLNPFISFFFR